MTATFKLQILVFPENITIATPAIPKAETTTKTVESNEKSNKTPSYDSTRNKNNKKACMITNLS